MQEIISNILITYTTTLTSKNSPRICLLFVNLIFGCLMPSVWYSCSSHEKIYVLKKLWSCSFALFIHNCSKLFTWKFSNPAMSKILMTPASVGLRMEYFQLYNRIEQDWGNTKLYNHRIIVIIKCVYYY